MRYGDASTYSFESDIHSVLDTRVFYLFGQMLPRQRDPFLRTALEFLAKIRDGKSPPEWLARVKRFYRCFVEQALDSPRLVAHRISTEESSSANQEPITIDDELRLIDELSLADLADIVTRFLTLDRFFLLFDGRVRFFDKARVHSLVKSYLA